MERTTAAVLFTVGAFALSAALLTSPASAEGAEPTEGVPWGRCDVYRPAGGELGGVDRCVTGVLAVTPVTVEVPTPEVPPAAPVTPPAPAVPADPADCADAVAVPAEGGVEFVLGACEGRDHAVAPATAEPPPPPTEPAPAPAPAPPAPAPAPVTAPAATAPTTAPGPVTTTSMPASGSHTAGRAAQVAPRTPTTSAAVVLAARTGATFEERYGGVLMLFALAAVAIAALGVQRARDAA